MATKSSSKGRKATSTARKGATKKAAQKAAPKGARTNAKAVKRGTTKATKAAKATKAKPAQGKAPKTSGAGQAKRLGSVTTGGIQISDIQIVPYDGPDAEDNIACRPRSPLNLIPDILSRVNVEIDPVDGRFVVTLVFNTLFGIVPGTVPGCNSDGLTYLPERSANIASVGPPEYIGSPVKRVKVKIFPLNPQQPLPFTFGFRLRFTQNISGPDLFKHFRKNGSVKVR
ncbi:MAG: hypothetical protein ACJ74W_06335 [Pyrinomonadaceae bacterium]